MSTRRFVLSLMFIFAAVLLASPVYAQEATGGGAADSALVQWSIITAGFALAIAAFGGRLEEMGRAVPLMAAALSSSIAAGEQIVIVGHANGADTRAIRVPYSPISRTCRCPMGVYVA